MREWTREYDNRGNGHYAQWWNILKDDEKVGEITTSEADAIEVCAMLNAAEILDAQSAKVAWVVLCDASVEEENAHRGTMLVKLAGRMREYAKRRGNDG